MNKDLKWFMVNHRSNKVIEIHADSGTNAWKKLAAQVGTQNWAGNWEIALPHAWSLYCGCRTCGVKSSHAFCSKMCFEKWENGV